MYLLLKVRPVLGDIRWFFLGCNTATLVKQPRGPNENNAGQGLSEVAGGRFKALRSLIMRGLPMLFRWWNRGRTFKSMILVHWDSMFTKKTSYIYIYIAIFSSNQPKKHLNCLTLLHLYLCYLHFLGIPCTNIKSTVGNPNIGELPLTEMRWVSVTCCIPPPVGWNLRKKYTFCT